MEAIHILLVEDNEGDIMLIHEALHERLLVDKVSVVRDGRQAIDLLNEKVRMPSPEMPDLILLDVNLPKMNGQEVLKYIKMHDSLKQIPVIMLTTSSAENDVRQSYRNQANCYITKPEEADGLTQVVQGIEDFWMHIVRLPSGNNTLC